MWINEANSVMSTRAPIVCVIESTHSIKFTLPRGVIQRSYPGGGTPYDGLYQGSMPFSGSRDITGQGLHKSKFLKGSEICYFGIPVYIPKGP